jgi:Eco57I restriction-modification methylase/restriction-modification enzyme MmeI-like protein
MPTALDRDPDLEWLDHVQPVGLVVAAGLLKELGLTPIRQTPIDTGTVAELLEPDATVGALREPWEFLVAVLGWQARYAAGSPGGPEIPPTLEVALPEHRTVLRPTFAVAELGVVSQHWQLLVGVQPIGVDPDARGSLDGWEATPHQRFERLLRDTGVFAGVLISDHSLRLVYAPRGETSGYLNFPLRPLGTVAGRPLLGGLKLLLDSARLFSDADARRLPALLQRSREMQASVSTALADQVLGALHELLRGFEIAESTLIRELAHARPDHVYEGLLVVLMRLVFVLYAEDRDMLPSRTDGRAREIYETSYSVRGLYAKLTEDAALNPDTMDERRSGWGRLTALFRLIHKGHRSRFMHARGGKLFDPDEFLFLEGRQSVADSPRILAISDGCLWRILEGLTTLRARGGEYERLSYRSLDVEQIGSVYETVMGFTVEIAHGHMLAIKAGKNHRTPVFVDLERLAQRKGKDRTKDLKERSGRAQLSAAQARAVEGAKSVEELASALDGIVDDRAAPTHLLTRAGAPILQPTGERRNTGSHYTPRQLTAPIVKHALEPAFERLGANAVPEKVLDLKVCDPAMGSGAFLVEACRAIAERLVTSWGRWPERRPAIPPDEDEQLHARRLVAQRCIYGVDRNARAVDLARLSLWLSTLARDHEFTFLDHALKCGDSLVGLSRAQMQSLHWDATKGLPLFAGLVRSRIEEAVKGRVAIREAADDVPRTVQEKRYQQVEQQIRGARLVGTAVTAAFFSSDKPKGKEKVRQEIESWAHGSPDELWPRLESLETALESGQRPVRPFHWDVEFPEVFERENPGFDAIVGNPPFLGGKRISTQLGDSYADWLSMMHPQASQNMDLVGHFFRRAFDLLRAGGSFGLVATNTIGQGDTREGGLRVLLVKGGTIYRAVRRRRWPGEAAVVVSIIHLLKGQSESAILDERPARRVSAYLVDGSFDDSPKQLAANSGRSFIGSIILGMGFTFDDDNAAKGEASSLADMRSLLERNPELQERVLPYIGGEELNNDPGQRNRRFAFNLSDLSEAQAQERFALLLELARQRVKPKRDALKRPVYRDNWWRFGEPQFALYSSINSSSSVLAISRVTPHLAFAHIPTGMIYADSLVVIVRASQARFAHLQSRAHELWARFLSSSMKDDLRYTPSDCFRTFPFAADFESDERLHEAGSAYHNFRAAMMVERNEGLTKTYNRFHDRNERSSDAVRLRQLHADMDAAVLRAYGWHDLAGRAFPEFIDQEVDEGRGSSTRLDWPAALKDETLARLLALNGQRAAAERAAGITAATDEGEGIPEDEGDSP